MVFHVTNYMRETNVWMIRKMRWILWGTFGFIPVYRWVYYDHLNRRVAWRNHWSSKTPEERQREANEAKRDWGYRPRYVPTYFFSIKARKYAEQSAEEKLYDTPRLVSSGVYQKKEGIVHPKDVRDYEQVMKEHNRIPGATDYNFPQERYTILPGVDSTFFYTVGGDNHRGVSPQYN